MSAKIKIIGESASDLSKELIDKYGFETLPMPVTIDGIGYLDGETITTAELFERVKATGKQPKTSAQSVGKLIDTFKKYTEQGYEVIYFALSSALSATYNNAKLAAAEVSGAYAVDTRVLSTGMALLMIKTAELIDSNEGISGADACEYAQNLADNNSQTSFVIDTLEYLHKGGRCSGLAALGANLLKLKPCLDLIGGKIEVTKKYRGNMALVLPEYVENRLKGKNNLDLSRVFVTHTGFKDPGIIESVKKRIMELQPFEEIIETCAGAGIATHCGPGTLGILFLTK